MSYIINIHTATETAIVALTKSESVIATAFNKETKQHATFLHVAIKTLLEQQALALKDAEAVGVCIGPGSYTGIRVGLAAAKGLCYALKVPLITYNSLELLAYSAINIHKDFTALYCPLIDARRMEVYTAIYNYEMEELSEPTAVILHEQSFQDLLANNKIFFFGSGAHKFKNILSNENAIFPFDELSPNALAHISSKKFIEKDFASIAHTQPLYLKEFQV